MRNLKKNSPKFFREIFNTRIQRVLVIDFDCSRTMFENVSNLNTFRFLTIVLSHILGIAFKVPMAIGCAIGFTIRICSRAKLEDINETIKDAAKCSLHGILCYTDEPVVSTDFRGMLHIVFSLN